MIRVYTREGFPHGFYDTDTLVLAQAEAILAADGVFHIQVVGADVAGDTLIPAREVI